MTDGGQEIVDIFTSSDVSGGRIFNTVINSNDGIGVFTSSNPNGGRSLKVAVQSNATVSYTGKFQTPLMLPVSFGMVLIPKDISVAGNAVYTSSAGIVLDSITYTEKSLTIGSTILTLSFVDTAYVKGGISITGLATITTLSFPVLTVCGGTVNIFTCPLLTSYTCPSLVSILGSLNGGTMALLTTIDFSALKDVAVTVGLTTLGSLTTLNFGALETVGSNFVPSTMDLLTTLTLTKLKFVGGTFNPTVFALLTTINCPALQYIGSSTTIATMASLTTISMPALISAQGVMTINSGLGNVSDVTIGTVGITKSILGNVNISGQKLTNASVERLLHVFASLDGTNGTTLWGAGKTLNISGGTSAGTSTLSAQGLADKATIISNGATVTMNA